MSETKAENKHRWTLTQAQRDEWIKLLELLQWSDGSVGLDKIKSQIIATVHETANNEDVSI